MKYGELDYLKGIIYFYMFLQSLFSWFLIAKSLSLLPTLCSVLCWLYTYKLAPAALSVQTEQ